MTAPLYAFDVWWSVDQEITPLREPALDREPEVRVIWGTRDECRLTGGGSSTLLWRGAVEGAAVTLERGVAGDHLFAYGDGARFHLSQALDELRCHSDDRAGHAWRRLLFDTVMFCTALLRGRRLLHAATVEFDGRVLAIAAPTGAGKSSLACELIRRGGSLFTDDVLTFAVDSGSVVCAPGPPLMNLPPATSLDGIGVEVALGPEDRELWVRVGRATREAGPLAAVVLLGRSPGAAGSMTQIAPNPLALLPHSIHLDSSARGAADRFTVMSDVVERVPIFALRADTQEAPTALARRMTDHLRDVGVI